MYLKPSNNNTDQKLQPTHISRNKNIHLNIFRQPHLVIQKLMRLERNVEYIILYFYAGQNMQLKSKIAKSFCYKFYIVMQKASIKSLSLFSQEKVAIVIFIFLLFVWKVKQRI